MARALRSMEAGNTILRRGAGAMRMKMMREILPDRRRSWTQEVVIEGHHVQVGFGEYEDGRLGEVFIDISQEGTFLRGVLGTLARTVSISLQHGASVEMIAHALRGIDYPPCGQVFGSPNVTECDSITDYVAREILANYGIKEENIVKQSVGEGDPIPEKAAGYISEPWRSGA